MIAATVAFTVMVSFAKVARRELSALDIILFRSATSIPLAIVFSLGFGATTRAGSWREALRIHRRGLMTIRLLTGFGAMVCFFTAAGGLAVADLSILHKLQPILIAILAPLLLGSAERPGRTVWLAIGLGLCGSALIVGPQLTIGSWFGLWALGGVVLSALAHVTVRALGKTERSSAIVVWFQIGAFALCVSTLLLLRGGLDFPPWRLVSVLIGCGISATIGQLLMTKAYALSQASTVAAASYAAVAFGALADILVFRAFPSLTVWLGGGLVVCAGLVLVIRR